MVYNTQNYWVFGLVNHPSLVQWLRLALSKGHNWVGFFSPLHLRTETDLVSETSFFYSSEYRTMEKVQKPSNSAGFLGYVSRIKFYCVEITANSHQNYLKRQRFVTHIWLLSVSLEWRVAVIPNSFQTMLLIGHMILSQHSLLLSEHVQVTCTQQRTVCCLASHSFTARIIFTMTMKHWGELIRNVVECLCFVVRKILWATSMQVSRRVY
jgi:hypothetical protein